MKKLLAAAIAATFALGSISTFAEGVVRDHQTVHQRAVHRDHVKRATFHKANHRHHVRHHRHHRGQRM